MQLDMPLAVEMGAGPDWMTAKQAAERGATAHITSGVFAGADQARLVIARGSVVSPA